MTTTSSRLLALLSLLQVRRDWPGALLADRLGVSPRTVRRDVDRLRELGYPVAALKGPDGGYRLAAGSELPPLLLDDDQAVAITVALQVLAADSGSGAGVGAGLGEAAVRALATLQQVLPARLRRRVETLRVTSVAPPSARPEPAVDSGVLLAVGAAVHAREVLRFDYGDGSADAPARRAEPHHLVTRGGRWYLVAWDLERADWRTFRLDRLRPRTPTGPRFGPRELPGGDVAAFVTARFRGGGDPVGAGPGGAASGGAALDGWPCRGEVLVDLPAAEVATYTRDGFVEEVGPARCRLVLGSWSWVALAAAVSRFDADVEVVGPPELAQACVVLADRLRRAAG